MRYFQLNHISNRDHWYIFLKLDTKKIYIWSISICYLTTKSQGNCLQNLCHTENCNLTRGQIQHAIRRLIVRYCKVSNLRYGGGGAKCSLPFQTWQGAQRQCNGMMRQSACCVLSSFDEYIYVNVLHLEVEFAIKLFNHWWHNLSNDCYLVTVKPLIEDAP